MAVLVGVAIISVDVCRCRGSSPYCMDYVACVHRVGSFDDEVSMLDIEFVGEYAVVAADDQGVRILDMSDPLSPVHVTFVEVPGHVRDVKVHGDLAFAWGYDVHIIDISDPTAPSVVGIIDTNGSPKCVVVEGNKAYVSTSNDRIQIYWLYPLDEPHHYGDITGLDYVDGFAVVGEYLFRPTYGILEVYDVSWPWAAELVASVETSGRSRLVASSGDLVFV
ncbi:hypothetical protein KKG45_08200 [bacterium]|nr:hypothetical protein [bacterium]MBU1073215.1 hypothetical protein [bacterium]MBU1676772.1 hypothetical protein [bacterium]